MNETGGTLFITDPASGKVQEITKICTIQTGTEDAHAGKTISISRECSLYVEGSIRPLAFFKLFGINCSNNYLKMHGGILQRKRHLNKKNRRNHESISM